MVYGSTAFIGMAAGARNAYVLAMDTIRQEKLKKDKAQQDEIDRKVEEYRKRQEKIPVKLRGDLC